MCWFVMHAFTPMRFLCKQYMDKLPVCLYYAFSLKLLCVAGTLVRPLMYFFGCGSGGLALCAVQFCPLGFCCGRVAACAKVRCTILHPRSVSRHLSCTLLAAISGSFALQHAVLNAVLASCWYVSYGARLWLWYLALRACCYVLYPLAVKCVVLCGLKPAASVFAGPTRAY
jgi:hypothetical protein